MIETINGRKFVDLVIVRQVLDTRGFIEMFENNLSRCKTFVQAYEEVELIHEQVTGRRRYTNYVSFSNVKGRLR
jgi:hypothetical protein